MVDNIELLFIVSLELEIALHQSLADAALDGYLVALLSRDFAFSNEYCGVVVLSIPVEGLTLL